MAVNTPYKDSTVTTTNHTANYDLPLWAGEDTTSWLTQMNDAMNKIDDGMLDAKSKALEVVGIAADAKKLADETKAESAASAKIVAGYNDRLTAAEEKIAEHTQDITNLNTRSDQFDVELHSVQEVQKKTTADLATLAAKVDTNKSDADTKISANTEAIARTDANVATLSGKVTALETEVGDLSSTTQTNTNAISAINTTIDGVKAKNTEQDGKITANTTEISSLDGRVTALEEGGGTKTLPTPIRNGLTLSTNSSSLYTITNSVVIIEDTCVYLSITFKLAGTLIPAGSNNITFDDANSPAITAIKEKFGENVALFGASSPLLLDPQAIAGTAKFMRFLTGGETTRVELNTNSSLSSTTATFKSSMIAVPSKE
nr:MAG TPA: hypothetical protein [Caudoviricetes sp.]